MAKLVEKAGGAAIVAPSMREIPLGDNPAVKEFAESLLNGEIDFVVFLTGVGTESCMETLSVLGLKDRVLAALKNCQVIARGPKPVAALHRLGVRVDVKAPEPNTWQELAAEIQRQGISLTNKRVAVQEYGIPSDDFYRWLRDQGAIVIPVPVYKWALPADIGPLENAIRGVISGDFDVLLWTSAQQVVHALEVAQRLGVLEQWKAKANDCFIGSIGPTASERLREYGLTPDLEPSHPKMAHLVRESLAAALDLISSNASDSAN